MPNHFDVVHDILWEKTVVSNDSFLAGINFSVRDFRCHLYDDAYYSDFESIYEESVAGRLGESLLLSSTFAGEKPLTDYMI
jgi:hypothetical protein